MEDAKAQVREGGDRRGCVVGEEGRPRVMGLLTRSRDTACHAYGTQIAGPSPSHSHRQPVVVCGSLW